MDAVAKHVFGSLVVIFSGLSLTASLLEDKHGSNWFQGYISAAVLFIGLSIIFS